MGPDIDPDDEDIGWTGLLWLFLSYGYALYYSSGLISEGSELLLLIPSYAGLVGSVVLPLLGAVPDGAIVLFSGLGDISKAQEDLSVGVGALAGSTIMLLTVPFALSVWGGRVDLKDGRPNYLGKPKLSDKPLLKDLTTTGVAVTEPVRTSGKIMMMTTIPYFLIQGPAAFLHGPHESVARGEHWWALVGLVICLIGLADYLLIQIRQSQSGEKQATRIAIVKKQLQKGAVSLSGALAAQVKQSEEAAGGGMSVVTESTPLSDGGVSRDSGLYPPSKIIDTLKEYLSESFRIYDTNCDGTLDHKEVFTFFRDFHESITVNEMEHLFEKYDVDKNGDISFDEFIGLAYSMIKMQDAKSKSDTPVETNNASSTIAEGAFTEAEEEEESVPEEFTSLSPDEQQAAIKRKAFLMLSVGTVLVLYFSDPMVDVLSAIAKRAGVPPFYVSFVLAPIASNASELLSSMYYASKKTTKTITVSLSALAGAASMNNTFVLSIFMGLVFFRGLAWEYTAETLSILIAQFMVGVVLQGTKITAFHGLLILMIFPFSVAVVAGLTALGFD